jgi:hypothetical protein
MMPQDRSVAFVHNLMVRERDSRLAGKRCLVVADIFRILGVYRPLQGNLIVANVPGLDV